MFELGPQTQFGFFEPPDDVIGHFGGSKNFSKKNLAKIRGACKILEKSLEPF